MEYIYVSRSDKKKKKEAYIAMEFWTIWLYRNIKRGWSVKEEKEKEKKGEQRIYSRSRGSREFGTMYIGHRKGCTLAKRYIILLLRTLLHVCIVLCISPLSLSLWCLLRPHSRFYNIVKLGKVADTRRCVRRGAKRLFGTCLSYQPDRE